MLRKFCHDICLKHARLSWNLQVHANFFIGSYTVFMFLAALIGLSLKYT
jgi:hypothetical protein